MKLKSKGLLDKKLKSHHSPTILTRGSQDTSHETFLKIRQEAQVQPQGITRQEAQVPY